jgi:hypothetical protein
MLNEGAARMFGALTDTMSFTVPTHDGMLMVGANPGSTAQAVTLGTVAMPLPAETACMVTMNAAGGILGLVGQGTVTAGGQFVAELPAPSVVFSPTGEPLAASAVLVASVFAEGELTIAGTAAGFDRFAVGEIVDGGFVVYERGALERTGEGRVTLRVDSDRRGGLLLMGEGGRFEGVGRTLAGWAGLRFDR